MCSVRGIKHLGNKTASLHHFFTLYFSITAHHDGFLCSVGRRDDKHHRGAEKVEYWDEQRAGRGFSRAREERKERWRDFKCTLTSFSIKSQCRRVSSMGTFFRNWNVIIYIYKYYYINVIIIITCCYYIDVRCGKIKRVKWREWHLKRK